jgi:hypothetical protein
MAGQVFDLGSILRRDDEAELVAIVPAAIEKGVTIGTILGRRIEPAALAIARGAIALDVAQMSSGLAAFVSGANGARLDDEAAATGLAMAPAVRQVARADEGRAAPALYAPAGRDRAVPTRLAGGSAAAARDSPGGSACWWAIFLTLVRKLLAWPAFDASERMRPGLGRKRLSSSALIRKL